MQDSVSVRTPAKINLLLDIIGKRDDGYHFVKTIMQAVSIFDEITVSIFEEDEKSKAKDKDKNKGIVISCSDSSIPCDERNLCYKATQTFFKYVDVKMPYGINIDIIKNIPALAGMGGGSSDAAGMLVALNEIMKTKLSIDELCDIAARVGADVPFCIMGATALAEGVGDILSPLPALSNCYFVIVKPSINISTPEAFAAYDKIVAPCKCELDDMIAYITVSDIDRISSSLFNALEYAICNDDISRIKESMLENGAKGALMTGSGSAVFGIFDKKKTACKCCDVLSETYDFVRVCAPVSHGIEINE